MEMVYTFTWFGTNDRSHLAGIYKTVDGAKAAAVESFDGDLDFRKVNLVTTQILKDNDLVGEINAVILEP
jgi:hypothetical protein